MINEAKGQVCFILIVGGTADDKIMYGCVGYGQTSGEGVRAWFSFCRGWKGKKRSEEEEKVLECGPFVPGF